MRSFPKSACLFYHLAGVGVSTMELDIAEDPVAIALLGSIDIMVVT